MATKREVEAMIRRKYGKTASLRENRNAATAAERADGNARRKEITARINEIDAELKTIPSGHDKRLLTAAEFVCDVNGDSPSIEQLRVAVAESQRSRALHDERKELDNERRNLAGIGYRHRFEACVYNTVGNLAAFNAIHESSDTLEELAAKLNPATELATC